MCLAICLTSITQHTSKHQKQKKNIDMFSCDNIFSCHRNVINTSQTTNHQSNQSIIILIITVTICFSEQNDSWPLDQFKQVLTKTHTYTVTNTFCWLNLITIEPLWSCFNDETVETHLQFFFLCLSLSVCWQILNIEALKFCCPSKCQPI